MANEIAEQVLKSVVKSKKLSLSTDVEHRHRGAFIWNRARILQSTLSAADISTRVLSEYDQLTSYIDAKLGPDDRSKGPLVPLRGGTGDKSPNHLDLLDLAKRYTADLTVNLGDQTSARAIAINRDAENATDLREKKVVGIVWRAGYLAPGIWNGPLTGVSSQLVTARLDEILDRRLRAIERMMYNVSSQNQMLVLTETADIPQNYWDLTAATPSSGWKDKLRVRLFEYPFVPKYFQNIVQDPTGATWSVQEETTPGGGTSSRLAYNVRQTVARSFTDGTSDTALSTGAWRFPAAVAPNWAVSPGDIAGFGASTAVIPLTMLPLSYRIDFVPSSLADGLIDAIFDFTATAPDGSPIRADYWNRAWMFCDHVISLLQLEALLFARRRRNGLLPAQAELSALAARRATVSVINVAGQNKQAVTPFVSLDGRVGVKNPINDHILMATQDLDTQTQQPIDGFFENTVVPADDLQIGDWVIIANSFIYRFFTQSGEWGLENALVLDVDTTVNNPKDRGKVRTDSLTLQGHGTGPLTHLQYRRLMAGVVAPSFQKMLTSLKTGIAANPTSITAKPSNTSGIIFKWFPFDQDVTKVQFAAGEQPIDAGPWWFPLRFQKFFATADEARAVIPKAVGGSMFQSKPNEVKVNPFPTIPNLPLNFTDWLLIPVFEPSLVVTNADRTPWGEYFTRKKSGKPVKTVLKPIAIDEQIIPGLFVRGRTANIGVVRPRVQP